METAIYLRSILVTFLTKNVFIHYMKLIVRLIVLIGILSAVRAQSDSVVCTAGSVANLPGINAIPWSVTNNNTIDDDMIYQSITLNNAITNCISDTLVMSNFNGILPANARITGIKVSILKNASMTAQVNDQLTELYLPSKGKRSPNKRINFVWPQVNALLGNYGGKTDLWSIDWELSDFSDPDLQLRFVTTTQTNSTGNANVDQVKLIVYYELKEIPQSTDNGPHVFYPMHSNLDQSKFMITEAGTAKIFDKNGVLVKQLQAPAEWDGTDAQGNIVPAGVYFLYVNEKERITITVLK